MRFSRPQDPNVWGADYGSLWCPAWAQPAVLWLIRVAERIRRALPKALEVPK